MPSLGAGQTKGNRSSVAVMSWEAVSAIGQVLGSLGVILSLLYLATQVRQNNRASTVSAKLGRSTHRSLFCDPCGCGPLMESAKAPSVDYSKLA
jgi:hypothetical protein